MDAINSQIWWALEAAIAVTLILIRFHESRVQSATLLIGKALAPPPTPGLSRNNGLQDALTYDYQKARQLSSIVCFLLLLVVGFQIRWYAGPLVIIIVLAADAILSRMFQKPVIFYVGRMIAGLQRRRAQYIRKSDTERAEACEWFESGLTGIYDHIFQADPTLRLPPFSMIQGSQPKEIRKWLGLEEPLF